MVITPFIFLLICSKPKRSYFCVSPNPVGSTLSLTKSLQEFLQNSWSDSNECLWINETLFEQQHSLNTRTAEAVNVKPDLSSHVPRLNWAHDNWALDGAEITVTWWPGICSKRSGETCCSSNWMYVWYLKVTQWMNEWMKQLPKTLTNTY